MASATGKVGGAIGDFIGGITDPVVGGQKQKTVKKEPVNTGTNFALISLGVLALGGLIALAIIYS